LVRKRKKSLHY